MSDSWLVIVPSDPLFRPDPSARVRLHEALLWLVPDAEEIAVEADSDDIRFFDCGENFESVRCNGCNAQFSDGDWGDWMSRDYGAGPGFHLSERDMPCCGQKTTLNDLKYDMPQGFARFALSAMNYNRGSLTREEELELKDALGTGIRIIYRYL